MTASQDSVMTSARRTGGGDRANFMSSFVDKPHLLHILNKNAVYCIV